MKYKSDWDANAIGHWIRRIAYECRSPYNDGWTGSGYKKELYKLKCLLDDVYEELPTFVGEEKWEQERLIEKLKK